MAINVRIRDGMCPDPVTEEGGATEGDIRGSFSDIIDTIGVKDLAGGHCLVTQNSPAAMSVLVAPGVVYIPNADYDELDSNQVKFWEAVITVSTAVAITANTSGSTRIDLICVKMDTAVTPDEHASNIATLVAVAGTPGAGAPATPDNYAKLAEIEVANGASTIVTAKITDKRVQAKIDFHYLPKATGAEINTGTEDGKIVTPKAIADSNYIQNKDGWISANETWAYASDSTITVPAGAAAKYAIGDRIRWKQGAGYKYGVLVAVADTVLTIAVNTDYTVVNDTITDNYYSHQASPIGYPHWFNYVPTLSQGASTDIAKTVTFAKYSLTGRVVTTKVVLMATGTGTAGSNILITLPIAGVRGRDYAIIGTGLYDDISSNTYTCVASYINNNTQAMLIPTSITTRGSGVGSTPSLAVASDDRFELVASYQI